MAELPRRPEMVSVERYFALVEEELIAPDDKVELLEGVIVAMSPQHASAVWRTTHALEAIDRCEVAVADLMPARRDPG